MVVGKREGSDSKGQQNGDLLGDGIALYLDFDGDYLNLHL